MSLLQTIKQHQLEARKAHEVIKTNLLTTLIGEASMIGKNDGNRETTDEEVIDTINKFIKNIKFTLEKVGGDLKSLTELDILQAYLPKQLTLEKLEHVIDTAIQVSESTTLKDMGKVMGFLKEHCHGFYDAKTASEIVKRKLS